MNDTERQQWLEAHRDRVLTDGSGKLFIFNHWAASISFDDSFIDTELLVRYASQCKIVPSITTCVARRGSDFVLFIDQCAHLIPSPCSAISHLRKRLPVSRDEERRELLERAKETHVTVKVLREIVQRLGELGKDSQVEA